MNYAEKPVFIISSERSGTNLVRKRITDSQRIYLGPSPAHFLKSLYYQQPYYGNLKVDGNFVDFITSAIKLCTIHFSPWKIQWTPRQILEDFGGSDRNAIALMHFMMNKYAQEQGFNGYVCKDNYLYEFALDISSLIPNAKFIFLYRDPRDYVLSQLKRPNAPNSIVKFARLWAYEQTKCIAVGERLRESGRCFILSYEDFIRDEGRKLDELFEFLVVDRVSGVGYSDVIVKEIHEWKNLGAETNKNNFGNYHSQLSARKVKMIEHICYLQMKHLGYQFDHDEAENTISRISVMWDYLFRAVSLLRAKKKVDSSDVLATRKRATQKYVVNYRNER